MKILIAHDGSEFGTSAVEFAARLVGSAESSQVKIVTVIEPAAAMDVEMMIESVEELKDPENPEFQKVDRLVRVAAEILREKTGIDVSYEVLAGPAAQKIVEEAETWGADLIVVGSHGRGFWNRVLIGSVSNRVLHHASCSVLVVRKG